MTAPPPVPPFGLAAVLADAVAFADRRGAGTKIAFGDATGGDILAPAGAFLEPAAIRAALRAGAPKYFFCFGSQTTLPATPVIAPLLETLIAAAGTGFAAACFANPECRRTVYQGQLFQGMHLRENLLATLSPELPGRVGLVSQSVTAAGALAIRARLAALKDQGYALALVDAIGEADRPAIIAAFAGIAITAGPAWLCPAATETESLAAPLGSTAILSGALDRQTLFQLGAAALAMPVLQLDFSTPAKDLIRQTLAWAAVQKNSYVIAASAPPDRLHPSAPVQDIVAAIAAGLAAAGATRFLLTGSDTAAAILRRLGITSLTAGHRENGLRAWYSPAGQTFLISRGDGGGRNLFLDQIEPYSRLNAAAE